MGWTNSIENKEPWSRGIEIFHDEGEKGFVDLIFWGYGKFDQGQEGLLDVLWLFRGLAVCVFGGLGLGKPQEFMDTGQQLVAEDFDQFLDFGPGDGVVTRAQVGL